MHTDIHPTPEPSATPDTLHVEGWPDPVIDRLGHDPRSEYVERFWLPVLGPSTTLLLRRLAQLLDHQPDGVELDLTSTAMSLGLGARSGRNGPFHRALDRCVQFHLARRNGRQFVVRRNLPPLSRGQVLRLPTSLRTEHDDWARCAVPAADRAALRRARRLALTLVQLGETAEETERQLDLWRFHPTVTRDATRWAVARAETRPEAPPVPPDAA